MITFEEFDKNKTCEKTIEYNNSMGFPIYENSFRPESEMFCYFFEYLRKHKDTLDDTSELELLDTDIGTKGFFQEEEVFLDLPYLTEEVELNKPHRGGVKKFYVYVKNDKGNVIKVSFGDTSGLTAKINDPEAVKSFVARHDCENKNDKTTPGYWSCRLPRYAKYLGLKGGGNYYW